MRVFLLYFAVNEKKTICEVRLWTLLTDKPENLLYSLAFALIFYWSAIAAPIYVWIEQTIIIGLWRCEVWIENPGIVYKCLLVAPTKFFVVIGWQGTFREEESGIWTAVINYWALYKVPSKMLLTAVTVWVKGKVCSQGLFSPALISGFHY